MIDHEAEEWVTQKGRVRGISNLSAEWLIHILLRAAGKARELTPASSSGQRQSPQLSIQFSHNQLCPLNI